jgi:hypothetical protein
MEIPVYLKFHNNGGHSMKPMDFMLDFWECVFYDYEVTIICEDETVTANQTKNKIIGKYENFQNEDWQYKLLSLIENGEKNWINPALANLTPTKVCQSNYFWIVDADDIHFEINTLEQFILLRDKIKMVEQMTIKKDYDFANLDINYTHHPYITRNNNDLVNWGHNSFGLVLMKNRNFYEFDKLEVKKETWGVNHDLILQVLHHKNSNKSLCFHFDQLTMCHYFHNKFKHHLRFEDDCLSGSFIDQKIIQKLAHSKKI